MQKVYKKNFEFDKIVLHKLDDLFILNEKSSFLENINSTNINIDKSLNSSLPSELEVLSDVASIPCSSETSNSETLVPKEQEDAILTESILPSQVTCKKEKKRVVRRVIKSIARALFLALKPIIRPIKRKVILALKAEMDQLQDSINTNLTALREEMLLTNSYISLLFNEINAVKSLINDNMSKLNLTQERLNFITTDIEAVKFITNEIERKVNWTNTELSTVKSKIDAIHFRTNFIKSNVDFISFETGLIKDKIHETAAEVSLILKTTSKMQIQTEHNQILMDTTQKKIMRMQSIMEKVNTKINSTHVCINSLNENVKGIKVSVYDIHSNNTNFINLLKVFPERLEKIESFFKTQNEILIRTESYSMVSAQRNFIYCGNSKVIFRTLFGYMVCSSKDRALLALLINSGEMEIGTRILIEKILKNKKIFVDVGANIGMHTIAAGRIMSENQGKIYAFEPYKPTAELLTESVFINGMTSLIEVIPKGISNNNSKHNLYLGHTCGHHSLHSSLLEKNAEKAEVELIRLDSAINLDTKIDLIKIDVEGHELEVLESAVHFIEGNDEIVLIVECGISHIEGRGNTLINWIRQFTELGLVYKTIDPILGELKESSLNELQRTISNNLIFAKPNASVWATIMQVEK